MKVFSFILALYMMALFVTPCADTHEKEAFQCHDHATEITLQYNHDHSETTDLCTPFCVCGCCGAVSGVVLQWSFFSLGKLKPVDLSKPEIYYSPAFIPRYFGEIWQPPKINA